MSSDRRRERLERIRAVSTGLFQRDGYEATPVNDVAAALEMSIGGLYRYISTKSDLLDLVCEGIYGDLPLELARIESSDLPPGRKLHELLASYIETCARNRQLILLMYREYRHLPPGSRSRFKEREQSIARIFSRTIVEAMATGEVRDVPADLLALDLVLIGHLPALKGWALTEGDRDETAIAEAQMRLVTALLAVQSPGPPPRRRRLSHSRP